MLPRGVAAEDGGHAPCDDGCSIEIDGPMVRVRGPSREAVFERVCLLLRVVLRGQNRPHAISAILHTSARPSGFDRWSIITGADIAFSPTGLDPHFPRALSA